VTPPRPTPAPRAFAALDGLRGLAAVFVAMRHTSFFHNFRLPGGYMAVDLFFVISGFVLAHAYEARLEAGLSPARFVLARYLRLWPVYGLGAILGLAAAWLHALSPRDAMTGVQVAETAPFALAMLPGPPIKPMLYPVNAVAWSLALELGINAVYAFAWRPLRRPAVLAGVLVVSGLALIGAVAWFGTLDVGFDWRSALGGLPRVCFSFAAGLAAYRLYRRGLAVRAVPAWVWVAALPAVMAIDLDAVIAPLVCVLVLFPALVFCAATAAQPGPRLGRVFLLLGAMSYPLYAIHKPAASLVALELWRHARGLFVLPAPPIGAVYLLILIGLCLLIERFYDLPVRRRLAGLSPRSDRPVAG
jgi:peptidoglycan/LPS O-acetylase OafA/YrhL